MAHEAEEGGENDRQKLGFEQNLGVDRQNLGQLGEEARMELAVLSESELGPMGAEDAYRRYSS